MPRQFSIVARVPLVIARFERESRGPDVVFCFPKGICKEQLSLRGRILILAMDLYGKIKFKMPYFYSRIGSIGKTHLSRTVWGAASPQHFGLLQTASLC